MEFHFKTEKWHLWKDHKKESHVSQSQWWQWWDTQSQSHLANCYLWDWHGSVSSDQQPAEHPLCNSVGARCGNVLGENCHNGASCGIVIVGLLQILHSLWKMCHIYSYTYKPNVCALSTGAIGWWPRFNSAFSPLIKHFWNKLSSSSQPSSHIQHTQHNTTSLIWMITAIK